jgi:hypothetical protein
MLPEGVSKALGIDLSEVLSLYFRELNDVRRGWLIGDAMDRRRAIEEGEEWLATEACERDIMDVFVHRRREDLSF